MDNKHVEREITARDIMVSVTYRNEKLVPVCQKEYVFDEYTTLIRNDLMRIITDVEDAIYDITGKKKGEWPDNVVQKFDKIKHKLLDKAGEIGRLPMNIRVERETPIYIDDLADDVKEILSAIRPK